MILSSIIMGEGPALIILHGLFGESKNWLSIGRLLSSKFEVHLIDQRNHGKSFHDDVHNYICLAEDLNNYITQKNIKIFSLIGHSMGGKSAMQFALLYPDKLHKLIIIDISPNHYNDDHSAIFIGLSEVLLKSNSRKEAIQILKKYINDVVVINFLLKSYYLSDDNIPKFKFNIDALEKNIGKILSCVSRKKKFSKMVYFLKGEKSNYISEDDFEYISSLFPVYEIIEIKGAGHWIHFDQKDIFLNTINKILK